MGSLSSHRFVSNDASQVCERVETASNRRHSARLEIVQDKAREQEREWSLREQLKLAVEKFVTDSLAAIFREHAKRIPISEGVCVLVTLENSTPASLQK